ncbi:rhomboid family intramembrane serine protease [Macrococcus hajekii]|uniref:Rhomboid family intramembrane serine protease n=1 Tax=Macrococcus hajekii TaxID=198482 RepID=A0A4R6BMF8_9STAP|nr:rhomboid family intramembrane serine protease [Macrococcus hajekii]TDM02908.1 rhomboid family intramembrane serine protease [Macrococcus hajekii]GGB04813.1 rhomboid family intramembrane serine protease [Macrococcus hajekii]
MITAKQLWATLYRITQYSKFELKQPDELLMVNKKEKRVIRFVTDKQTVQSLDFLIQKINDNAVSRIGFIPKKIDIYLVNQPVPAGLSDSRVEVHELSKQADLQTMSISKPYQVLSKIKARQSESFYRKRMVSDNIIDRAMIKFTPVTLLLLLINIVIFLFNLALSFNDKTTDFIETGGLSHFNFVHGEYFRVISSMFLHFDFSHLLFNMMSLYIFGKLVEYFYGSLRFIVIYIVSGLFGNLLSLSFETTAFSVGASGAISGLLGALFAYMLVSRRFDKKMLIQTAIGLIIFLLLSNLFSNVNNWAHFGGLFSGFYMGLLLYTYRQSRQYCYMMIAGLFFITILLFMNIFSVKEEHIYNDMTRQAMQEGDFKKAEKISRAVFDKGFEDDETYHLNGLIKSHNISLAEGIAEWKKGLKIYPESPTLNYQMALAMRATDDYKEADKYLKNAEKYIKKQDIKDLKKELKVFGD